MDETFQAKILHFLRDGRAATFQEIVHATDISEEGLSLALGIMLRSGTVSREPGTPSTRYRLMWTTPIQKPSRGMA